jgi:cytochrome c oxidase assembly protein subunit 15
MDILTKKNYYKPFLLWQLSIIILLILMIVIGGLTRLTDSGLSITQWNLISGIFPPLNDSKWQEVFSLYKEIPQFFLINKNITLSEFKIIYYWEYIHRLLGRLIGLIFLLPFIYFTYKKVISKKYQILLSLVFLLICFQGFIGWYMVMSGLVTDVTVSHYRLSLHLFLAFIILSINIWIFMNLINSTDKKFFISLYNDKKLFLFIILLYLQVVIGAFVSGLDAGKVYQTWPLMNTSFFPNEIKLNNFFLLFNFKDHGFVQFIHRNIAYIIFLQIIFIGFRLFTERKNNLYKIYSIVLILIFLQIFLGIFALLSDVNIFIAIGHQISSIFLIICSLNLHYKAAH